VFVSAFSVVAFATVIAPVWLMLPLGLRRGSCSCHRRRSSHHRQTVLRSVFAVVVPCRHREPFAAVSLSSTLTVLNRPVPLLQITLFSSLFVPLVVRSTGDRVRVRLQRGAFATVIAPVG